PRRLRADVSRPRLRPRSGPRRDRHVRLDLRPAVLQPEPRAAHAVQAPAIRAQLPGAQARAGPGDVTPAELQSAPRRLDVLLHRAALVLQDVANAGSAGAVDADVCRGFHGAHRAALLGRDREGRARGAVAAVERGSAGPAE